MASLEVHHQIHCVVSFALSLVLCMKSAQKLTIPCSTQNLLWQGTYMEYYKNRSISFTDSAHTVREHLGMPSSLIQCQVCTILTLGCARPLRRSFATEADVRR